MRTHLAIIAPLALITALGCQGREAAQPSAKAPGPAVATPPGAPGQAPKMDHVVKIPMNQGSEVLQALQAGKPIPAKVLEQAKARAMQQRGMGMPAGMPGAPAPQLGQPAPKGPGLDRQVGLTAQRNLRSLYELITGKSVRVVSATPDSGMWRFVFEVEAGGKKAQQVTWVTGDGRRFFEGEGVHLQTRLETLKRDKRFAACLADKKVRVFGDPRGKTTMKQLDVVGKFAGMVFIDCSKNPKGCAKLGVTKLPSVAVGDDVTTGVQQRSFFETATGCK